EHLAEPRPEFGHATNAVAVIGRRALTRGLFLDRRAFLLSYDPTRDLDGEILERTLAAATPVGAGINLEYYFSHVDNERYGAGSKLPHNITGLFGVMSGHASDLRTGLPRQMIEIHEPVRLLVIVEATPSRLLDIASRQPEVKELVVNRWVQLVSLHPELGAMQIFTDRGFVPFEPQQVTLREGLRSADLFQGHSDFVPPARILERVA
ncbi:MAG TPA: putative inorganic carbon transporter subunit DabA, partial [Polyangiales bacterium]